MKSHDFQRRTVLHGSVAAGVSLVLLGCKAKQEEAAMPAQPRPSPVTEPPAAVQASPPPGAAASADGAPSTKMTQAQAQYQTQPKGEQKCANCNNFIAESSTCKVVEGPITPDGWCIVWTALAR